MASGGTWASSLSTVTIVYAGYQASNTYFPSHWQYCVLCGVVYSVSIDNTFDNPIRISSIIESDNSPSLFTNLSCDTERTWKQSAEESFVSPFLLLGSILIIQGAISYRSFQSVIGTIIFKGSFPNELSFTIIAGRIFLISAPIVGSRLINQTSFCFIKIYKIYVGKCC